MHPNRPKPKLHRSFASLALPLAAVLFALIVATSVKAQPNPASQTTVAASSATTKAADQEWATLKAATKPTAAPSASKAQQVASFLAQAQSLRDFQQKYPDHASVKEAKQQEVLCLNWAALQGDTTQETRRQQLLDEVRKDTTIPADLRFGAVAWSNQVNISRQGLRDHAALLAAQEKAGRGLVAEFPGDPVGYESLLAVARNSAPDQAKIIAGDILMMAEAPSRIKTEAQWLLDRFVLLGRPLEPLLTRADATSLVTKNKGTGTVIYAWSSAVPGSLPLGKRLAQQAPKASFIGVCLDADIASAKQTAAGANMPGEQYYDTRGSASPLASALKINRPYLVYLVDRDGVIRDVQGTSDFLRRWVQINP